MYGLEAINANNGWAMAFTGPLIVMSGLIILSIIISQLHKLINFFDKKTQQATEPPDKGRDKDKDEVAVPQILPNNILETARIYQGLIDKLEQPFELSDLYKLAEKNNFPHPILTVSRLRDAGILAHEGDGLFSWNR